MRPPDQVQAHVDAADDARRSEHGPVGGKQDVTVHVGGGSGCNERVEQAPVCGGRASVEQPGRGKGERAGAQCRNAYTGLVRGSQGICGIGRHKGVWVGAAGDDDEVAGKQGAQIMGGREVADGLKWLFLRRRGTDP